MTPFPLPARRTERAQLTHSALGQDIRRSPTEACGFLPRLTLEYCLTSDIAPNVVVSEGNHPGTFTTNPNSAMPAPVQEETLWNYEAGMKSEFFERHLQVNFAAYHEVWCNQYLLENALYFSEQLQSEQTRSILTNVGRSHIDGMELEIAAIPVTGLDPRALSPTTTRCSTSSARRSTTPSRPSAMRRSLAAAADALRPCRRAMTRRSALCGTTYD